MTKWLRRFVVTLSLLGMAVSLAAVVGCGNKRERAEDPKEHPDFVDTSDPSMLKMPPMKKGE